MTETEAIKETRVTVAQERADKGKKFAADLDARTEALVQVLGQSMDVDRFKRVVAIAVSKNPELYDCTRESLLRAILEAAQDGLEPTGPMGGAHLVPFRNSSGQMEAVLIRDYRGLYKMARRGEVLSIQSGIVHEGDVFELQLGSEPYVRFIPVREGKERGNYQGVFTKLKFKDPRSDDAIEYMTIADVNKVRDSTRGGGKRGPWADWYDEMVIKTALRHALKLYATPEMYEQLAREDAVETAWDEPENRPHPSVERRERLVASIAPERVGSPRTADAVPEPEPARLEPDEVVDVVLGQIDQTFADDARTQPVDVELLEAARAERDPARCESHSPFDDSRCDLPIDHAGIHRVGQEQSWPK